MGLAEYLAGLRYEDIPEEVTDRAKKLTMHTIGVTLAAKGTACVERALSTANDTMGQGGDSLATV